MKDLPGSGSLQFTCGDDDETFPTQQLLDVHELTSHPENFGYPEGTHFEVIAEEDVPPTSHAAVMGEWLGRFRSIPAGKAWEISEEEAREFGVKVQSIVIEVHRLKKTGLLGPEFYATQRKEGGKIRVWIVHKGEVA